jgi:hypothetical protein
MKVHFTSVGDEFLQPLFFTSQSLHPRVVLLNFSVCALSDDYFEASITANIFLLAEIVSTKIFFKCQKFKNFNINTLATHVAQLGKKLIMFCSVYQSNRLIKEIQFKFVIRLLNLIFNKKYVHILKTFL